MELRNLKTFEAVCRWGSFTAAAEGLGYAQSSVTAQIKQLEQETGCVLFDRLGKTPTLTAQGAVLLDYAREVLSRTDEVLTRLADKEPAGLLRVGAFESVGAAFLPGVLSRVKRDWPGIELTVSTGDHQILDELLYNDRVDMVWTCETLQREDLHCLASFTHELAVVCAPDHPMAGKRGSTKKLEADIRALDVPAEIVLTQETGDARRIARAAAETGEDVRLYACGGDGTLNEAVNGAAGCPNAAVTNVPIGTGNDFLKIFGRDYRAGFSDLKALSEGPQAAMDLIDCNGHLGLDIVCTGVDARIAVDKDGYKLLPLVSGMGAYIFSLVANVLFKPIAVPTVVDCGDLHFEGETTIVCVCSGRYYGGGFMPVGDNMPDDGVLETLVIPKVSRATFFRLVGRYAQGKYRDYPELILHRRGDGATVRGERELVAVVDGEPVRAKELVIRLSEKKVNFFYPAGMAYDPPG